MADRVQAVVEKMLPELQHLAELRLFSFPELRQIVKERTQHEYNIIRRTPYLTDFLRYIQFEVKVEITRRSRAKHKPEKWKLFRKRGISDHSILGRTFNIFNRALIKFPNNIALWFKLIDWALALKSFGQLSKIFPRALRFHPLSPQLWQRAAMYEFDILGNVETARVYFQRGLRLNPKSFDLWSAFFDMELNYIGRIAKRHALNNVLPTIERAEQYDNFVTELQRQQQQSGDDLDDEKTQRLLKNASSLPWTPENATVSKGDRLLLSGAIAKAIYNNACQQFTRTDGIVSTVVGLSNYYSHRNAMGLSIKQKLSFLSLINNWKAAKEEKGLRKQIAFDDDLRDAQLKLNKEIELVKINEHSLLLADINLYSLYQHILLDIFNSIHQNIFSVPDLFTNDLFSGKLNTELYQLQTGKSDIKKTLGLKQQDDSDSSDEDEDFGNSDNALIQLAQQQQERDKASLLGLPPVEKDDIGAFWDCFARLSLYCAELEFDLPMDLLEELQLKSPSNRQFTFELDFPVFPTVLPQLEQRALTRYLFGLKVYASFPAFADCIPLVLGKLIKFLYRRIKFYFNSLSSVAVTSVLQNGTPEYQFIYQIGYALVNFFEQMLSWAQYQHQQYNHLQYTHSELGSIQTASIPWVSSEMYTYWLKLKNLTIKNVPIYHPETDPAIFTLNSLPKLPVYTSQFETLFNEIKQQNKAAAKEEKQTTKKNKAIKSSQDSKKSYDKSKLTSLKQLPPSPNMLQSQTLFQVIESALHFIRERIYTHNFVMAHSLSSESDSAGKSTNLRTQLTSQSNKKFTQYYDTSLEKLIAMIYLTYSNFILRPHWTVVESKTGSIACQKGAEVLNSQLKQSRHAVMSSYVTLFELHAIILSSNFIDISMLTQRQQNRITQKSSSGGAQQNINIHPLLSIPSIRLYWDTFLKLHTDLGLSMPTFSRTKGVSSFLTSSSNVHKQSSTTNQSHYHNNTVNSANTDSDDDNTDLDFTQSVGSLVAQRSEWLLPLMLSTILNSRFFQQFIEHISAVKLTKNSSHHMTDISIFMHLAGLRYFQLIKEGYISSGSNIFIPTTSNSAQIASHTVLSVLHFTLNSFKQRTIAFCNTFLCTLSINLLLYSNNSVHSADALSLMSTLNSTILENHRKKSSHEVFRREQAALLQKTLQSDDSDSDSNSDSDSDDSLTPSHSARSETLTSLSTIQNALETCLSAIHAPHNAATYNACLRAFINVYQQQESQFIQFNQLQERAHDQPTSSSVIRQQQTILQQLHHRIRKLFIHASHDIGRSNIWIWIHYAHFLSYLQNQCNLTTSSTNINNNQNLAIMTKSSHAHRAIMTINNDQLTQYSLELMNEIGSVQQNAITTLRSHLRPLFVTKIDELLHKK